LRDHFDQKVASVVRKEALVDKLAQEWEEHFQLTTQREEMVATYGENSEEVESLSIQLKFKESRIRQFAQRLGRDHQASDETSTFSDKKSDAFLFDKELSKVCGGSVDDAAKNTIALVLFGMIVRERRRVAALARTASSLDERAHAAEKAAAGNEEALQSYMEEQRQEVAASTLAQRNQVIALMGIIMRNTIILIDQVRQDLLAGVPAWIAVREAAVRRFRPITLTAVAAILAMIPLTRSVLWGPMAVAIMAGLIVATVLTILAVPAIYAAWYRLRPPAIDSA
jgi:hypothetical protein